MEMEIPLWRPLTGEAGRRRVVERHSVKNKLRPLPRLATDVSLRGDVDGSVHGVGLSNGCVGFGTLKRFLGADRVYIEANG